jgi:hypothetical protein
MSKTSIKRVEMLREFDVKETPQGKQHVFSVCFITAKGERVFLPRAVATGVNCDKMQAYRLRGVVAVDAKGDKIGHIYPVRIDNFVMWNSKKVYL